MKTQFPAGLNDAHFEIYKRGSDVFALNNGMTISYSQFPSALLNLIDRIIVSRPKAAAALDQLGLFKNDERRLQFISCNLANFDFSADISACLTKITTEYVSCPLRGKCSHEGKLCTGIIAPGGFVSVRKLRIMGMIRKGLYDKEIAEALNISAETLKSTKRDIQRKFKIERKAMIANVAAIMQIN